jgi:hypothetical protein
MDVKGGFVMSNEDKQSQLFPVIQKKGELISKGLKQLPSD